MKKTLIRTLACIAGAAIIAALGRTCNNSDDSTLRSQQQTSQNMNPSYPMHVDSTELLTIYDITDCPIDLACGQMPDTTQENVLLCAAAAFTGQCLDYFEHSNILGPHVSGGILYEGYTENKEDIPFAERYALFTWGGKDLNGNMLAKKICHFPCDDVLQSTVEHGGMAFTQHWVIKNGAIYEHKIQPLNRVEYFRSLCQKGNRFYIIANREVMAYQDYLQALLEVGVEHALYMDMGAGWNHSFYRDAEGKTHIIHPKGHSYPTNWLVVMRGDM